MSIEALPVIGNGHTDMTTASSDSGYVKPDKRRDWQTPPRFSSDPALFGLLARRDDRLLHDAGLSREDVLGVEGAWWSEWRRSDRGWNL